MLIHMYVTLTYANSISYIFKSIFELTMSGSFPTGIQNIGLNFPIILTAFMTGSLNWRKIDEI